MVGRGVVSWHAGGGKRCRVGEDNEEDYKEKGGVRAILGREAKK